MPLPGRRGRVGRDGPRGPRELEHVPIPETLVEAVGSPSPSGVQEHEGSPRGAFASVCLQNQGSGQSPATHVGGRGDAPEPSAGGEPSSRPEGEPKDLHRCHQAMSDHGGEGDVLGGPGVRSFSVATEGSRVPRTAERLVHQEDLIDLPPGGKVVDGEDPLLRHVTCISSPLLNVCLTPQRADPRSRSGGPARRGSGGGTRATSSPSQEHLSPIAAERDLEVDAVLADPSAGASDAAADRADRDLVVPPGGRGRPGPQSAVTGI